MSQLLPSCGSFAWYNQVNYSVSHSFFLVFFRNFNSIIGTLFTLFVIPSMRLFAKWKALSWMKKWWSKRLFVTALLFDSHAESSLFPFILLFSRFFFSSIFNSYTYTTNSFTLFVVIYICLFEHGNTLSKFRNECSIYYVRRYFYFIRSCIVFSVPFLLLFTRLFINLLNLIITTLYKLFTVFYMSLFVNGYTLNMLKNEIWNYFTRHFYMIHWCRYYSFLLVLLFLRFFYFLLLFLRFFINY